MKRYTFLSTLFSAALALTSGLALPAMATSNTATLSVSSNIATVTTDASGGGIQATLELCMGAIQANSTWSNSYPGPSNNTTCVQLFDQNGNAPTLTTGTTIDISTLKKQTGQNTYAAWSSSTDGQYLIFALRDTGNNNYFIWSGSVIVSSGGNSGGGSQSQSVANTAPEYNGPEFSNPVPLSAGGGTVKTTGKKLSDISSVKINGASIGFKANSDSELELTIPADLAPGKYDLEITSSYGRLIQIDAITVKAPTQAANFSLKGSGLKVDANMLAELSNIGSMFNADYKKITCVVNAADAATAQTVADKVCRTLKAGELRSAATKSVAKSSFKGEGYWVRVYLAG